MSYQQAIERGTELLTLCQRLQSEGNGVDRPAPGVFDKTKTLDTFAMDIDATIRHLHALSTLYPMMIALSRLGRKLEAEGKITRGRDEGYSPASAGVCVGRAWTGRAEALSTL